MIGAENMYRSSERLGAALDEAYTDAQAWITAQDDDGHATRPCCGRWARFVCLTLSRPLDLVEVLVRPSLQLARRW